MKAPIIFLEPRKVQWREESYENLFVKLCLRKTTIADSVLGGGLRQVQDLRAKIIEAFNTSVMRYINMESEIARHEGDEARVMTEGFMIAQSKYAQGLAH